MNSFGGTRSIIFIIFRSLFFGVFFIFLWDVPRTQEDSCGSRGFPEDRMMDIITGRVPPLNNTDNDQTLELARSTAVGMLRNQITSGGSSHRDVAKATAAGTHSATVTGNRATVGSGGEFAVRKGSTANFGETGAAAQSGRLRRLRSQPRGSQRPNPRPFLLPPSACATPGFSGGGGSRGRADPVPERASPQLLAAPGC